MTNEISFTKYAPVNGTSQQFRRACPYRSSRDIRAVRKLRLSGRSLKKRKLCVMTENQIEEFLAARREEARLIDPATAETTWWWWGKILDPYGVFELSPEEDVIGRLYFARRSGGDVWVESRDLPEETREAIRNRGKGDWPPSFTRMPDGTFRWNIETHTPTDAA
jgi:hypothetical protein